MFPRPSTSEIIYKIRALEFGNVKVKLKNMVYLICTDIIWLLDGARDKKNHTTRQSKHDAHYSFSSRGWAWTVNTSHPL